MLLKQQRQSENFLMYDLGRPQIWHLFLRRDMNFAGFWLLIF